MPTNTTSSTTTVTTVETTIRQGLRRDGGVGGRSPTAAPSRWGSPGLSDRGLGIVAGVAEQAHAGQAAIGDAGAPHPFQVILAR
jgi:hypothetical protein